MKERDQGKQGPGVRGLGGWGDYNPKGTYTLRNKKELEGKK